MTKFFSVQSPSGNYRYIINLEQIAYIQPSTNNAGQCTIYFTDDKTLSVGVSAEEIASAASRRV